jgi:predicted transcriptional regulator of viral defense system
VRRFGWLADHIKADLPQPIRERLMQLASQSRKTWLGPDPAREGVVAEAMGYDKKWRLFVNVTREELHGSAGLGQRKAIRKGL